MGTSSSETFSIEAVTGALSVYSIDPAEVGDHTLVVTVALVSYPTILVTKNFIVSITQIETTMTAAFIPDFSYIIEGD